MRLAAAFLLLAALPVAAEDLPRNCAEGPPDQPVAYACYERPTRRYGHGALGDRGEWERLSVVLRIAGATAGDGGGLTRQLRIEAPDDGVFEDVAPRLADLDGDGIVEIVAVESTAQGGAALVVFRTSPEGVVRFAATPPIGQRHRWLAPAGIADLDGDGRIEIAYVETPHLAGILRVWRLAGPELVEIASAEGFSNHSFGAAGIVGGVRDCGAGTELVLPDRSRRQVMAVRLDQGSLRARPLGPMSAGLLADAMACIATD